MQWRVIINLDMITPPSPEAVFPNPVRYLRFGGRLSAIITMSQLIV